MPVFQNYAYLWATLAVIAALFAVAMFLPARQRQIAVFSGLVNAPTGIFAPTFNAYWTPERLGGGPLGVEDFLFSFAAGMLAWMLVVPLPLARGLRVSPGGWAVVGRIAVFVLVIPTTYITLWVAGFNPMTACLLGLALGGAIALWLHPDLWPLALPAAIAYPSLHGLATAIAISVWPNLADVWISGQAWGYGVVRGVPLGELIWASAFGAVWPPVVAHFLGARHAR